MDDRLIGNQSSIVEEITRGEIVRSIKNNIVICYDTCHVAFIEALNMGDYFYIWVEGLYCFARRLGLILSNALSIM